MSAKKRKSINLLPQEEFDSSSLGRALKWALSSFRVMVIVTELIVMGAFLSRFWLDAKNSDLNDSIKVAKAQIMAYSDIEKEIRLIQTKLSVVRDLYAEKNHSSLLDLVSNSLPPDVTLNSISTSNGNIVIKARSGSERSVAQLMVNLQEGKFMNNVRLSQLSSSIDNDAITTFTINAEVANTNIPVKSDEDTAKEDS